MLADPETEAAILDVLKKYSESYGRKDLAGLMEITATDPDMVAIGTGPDEWVVGAQDLEKNLRRDMDQAESVSVEFENVTVSTSGNAAWFSAVMIFDALVQGREITMRGRFTGVLENREGRWLFVQLHFSVPAGGQEEGQSFPISG